MCGTFFPVVALMNLFNFNKHMEVLMQRRLSVNYGIFKKLKL